MIMERIVSSLNLPLPVLLTILGATVYATVAIQDVRAKSEFHSVLIEQNQNEIADISRQVGAITASISVNQAILLRLEKQLDEISQDIAPTR